MPTTNTKTNMIAGKQQKNIVRRSNRISKLIQSLRLVGFGLVLVGATLGSVLYTRAGGGARAYAAANAELNFQARLLASSGAIVPDGNTYSVEFKLYDAASGGSVEWAETQSSVTVKAGYLSVHLGSVTPFPSTIDWSQGQWLTMNVNGDGEMSPRLQLTSVPAAFHANESDALRSGANLLTADDLVQLAPGTPQVINSALAALRLNQTGSGALFQLQHNGSDVFEVANNGDVTSSGSATFSGGTVNIGAATQAGGVVLSDGSSNTATINSASLSQDTVYTLPSIAGGSATICVSTGNCGGSGDISQNGNAFGADVTIGTNDAFNLNFETNGTTQLSIDTSGDANLINGGLQTAGTTRLTNGGALQNVTGDNTDGVSFNANTITSGVLSDSRLSSNVTLQGNAFNGANNLVKLDGSGKFVAIDASALTNLTAANLTGQVAVVNGGTGLSSVSANGILYGNGTSPLGVATGSAGQFLQLNSGGVPTLTTLSGDATLSSSGVLTIGNGAVTNAKLQNSSFAVSLGTNLSGSSSVSLGGTLTVNLSATPTFTTVTTGALNTTGALTFNSFGGSAGLLKVSAAGAVTVSTAGSDYEVPLTFNNGLTRSSNTVKLGGPLTGLTDIALGGNNLTFSGSGLVGIGTASPGYQLDMRSNSSSQIHLSNTSNDNGAYILGFGTNGVYASGGAAFNGTSWVAKDATASIISTSVGSLQFFSNSGLTAGSTFAPTARFAVDGGGNGAFNGVVAVNGNALTSLSSSFTLLAGPTTVNAFGAATTLSLGTASGTTTINGNTLTSTGLTFGGAGATTIQAANNQGLTVRSQGTGGLTLTSGNGTIVLGSSTLQRSAASFTFDLANGASNSVFAFDNSGAGAASVNLQDGDLQTAGTTRLTNAGALQNITGLTVISGGASITGNSSITGTLGVSSTLTVTSGGLVVSAGGASISGGLNMNSSAITGATNITASGTVQAATVNATTTFQLNGVNGRTLNCSSTEGIDDVEIRGGILITSGCRGFGLSDINLKQNIVSLSNSVLDNIRNVNVVNFDFDCSNGIFVQNGGKYTCDSSTQTGVIAQQLEAIFPGLVFTGADGYKRVNYEGLSMYTLKAVQELAGLVDSSGNIAINDLSTGGTVRLTDAGVLQNITGLTIVSGGANITGGIDNNSGGITEAGSISGVSGLTFTSGGIALNGGGITGTGSLAGVTGIAFTSGALNLNSGGITNAGSIAGATNISASGAITAATSTNTINGLVINSGALSSVTTINASGAITAATSTNTINGLVISSGSLSSVTGFSQAGGAHSVTGSGAITLGGGSNALTIDSTAFDVSSAGALSGITTIGLSGAITGATSTNTINGLVINSGALSSITGFSQTSGTFGISGSGAINIGGGSNALTINSTNFDVSSAGALSGITTINASGAITAATSTNTINGLVISSGALSSITTITASGNITLNNGTSNTITSTKELVLEQTGDTFGTSRLRLQNRNGSAGALFENVGLDLVDFGFKPNTGPQANLRFEHRSGSLVNAGNTSGEFQFLDDATGTSTYTIAFGKAATTVNQGNLNVAAGAIQLAGTTLINNNRSLSNVTGITFTSGGLNLANGGITNGGAFSGITTLNLSGAISGATATNTINGLIINSGSLSGITGYNQASGAFTIGGTGAITLGGGSNALTINSAGFDVSSAGVVTASSTVSASGYKVGATNGVTASCANNQFVNQMTIAGGIITGTNGCKQPLLSDIRLKENITPLDNNVLDKIKDVNTVNFDFNCGADLFVNHNTYCETDRQTGVIAQELAQIFPELVFQDDNGYFNVNYQGLSVVTLKATSEIAQHIDTTGNVAANSVATNGTVRISNDGKLQNINGLKVVSGGASLTGGIDNNGGGITNVGAISGATTIDAQTIRVNANATDNMLELKKDTKGVFTVFNNGALQIQLDADNAFAVKNADGDDIFTVSTQGGLIRIGAGSADSKAILLVLDSFNGENDPVGVNGAQYYNATKNKFRCYQNGAWQDCLPNSYTETILSSQPQSWLQPVGDQEYPGQPRNWVDLTNVERYRVVLNVINTGVSATDCRLQYAFNDSGPWEDLTPPDEGSIEIRGQGTPKTQWFSIKQAARKEVLVRMMCSHGNQITVDSVNSVRLQLEQ